MKSAALSLLFHDRPAPHVPPASGAATAFSPFMSKRHLINDTFPSRPMPGNRPVRRGFPRRETGPVTFVP